MDPVLAVLGQGLVPASTPVLRADDLGTLRGDGVFESMHVRDGRPWLQDAHLDRMERSAGRIELALPPREELAALCAEACAAWPSDLEGVLRVVCTRGPERGGPVTCYATLGEILETQLRQRREGVRIATASLGFTAAARDGAPWMLGGVKSLSYAVNMASQRWAAKQGLDDVLWVSADGYALEAPTSTLLWLEGDVLFTVPVTTGILPGTTARHLLDRAPELDWRAGERMVRPAELQAADGVWLVSSVRGVTAVRELDGAALTVSPQHKALQELAGFDT